eukprot:GGOE01041716.1.p1 GENE.GGOE01041716.1~~GGOE01041716.1.p1  ORF type:complete len:342 (-),score=58.55 GGOE01041716.1:118-1086(-)
MSTPAPLRGGSAPSTLPPDCPTAAFHHGPLQRNATTPAMVLPGSAAAKKAAEVSGCPWCEAWQQKYSRLRQAMGTQRKWLQEQRDVIHTWEASRQRQTEVAGLEAHAASLQEQLAKAQRESEAQATRIMDLELTVRKLESKLKQQADDCQSGRPCRRTSAPSQRDVVHDFEQAQATILHHLRQKASTLDPYDDSEPKGGGRQGDHPHLRRDACALCGPQCARYFDKLAGEIDVCHKVIAEHQATLQEQQRKHTITLKAVNDKYKELKQVNGVMQQRISCLVYQLQAAGQTRAISYAPSGDHATAINPRGVRCDLNQPQYNFG